MVEVKFDITVDATGTHETPLLADYEVTMMLHHTQAQIEKHVQQSLDNLRCEKHGEPARVRISGTYSADSEQLDISYHVDTCCQLFLLRAVAALNLSRA